MDTYTLKFEELTNDELKELVGIENKNINLLKDLYKIDLIIRNNEIKLFMEDNNNFNVYKSHLSYLITQVKGKQILDHDFIEHSYLSFLNNNSDLTWQDKIIGYSFNGKPIKFKTENQAKLFKALETNDLVFSIGPAGTGKTYLGVLFAALAYKKGDIRKIILTRPAVEAGESLGFLPGDLKEKINPYLMPLYDALEEILGEEQVNKLIERNAIEVIPLAYMRGRTLNDAFVILDEAQNTTTKQMLMFLTRLGKNTKMIVNGDISQIDLNLNKESSGLVLANKTLRNIERVAFLEFDNKDIVRSKLVSKIIDNYKE